MQSYFTSGVPQNVVRNSKTAERRWRGGKRKTKKMFCKDLKNRLFEIFNPNHLDNNKDEWGLRIFDENRKINKVGWATTLLPDVINNAIDMGLDLIITHHDAWSFLYDLQQETLHKLKDSGIAHLFVHILLDEVNFGTSGSILSKIGCSESQPKFEKNGINWARIGELEEIVHIDKLESILTESLHEQPRYKNVGSQNCKRIAVVTGGGCDTTFIKEAVENDCDTFITGEYNCYFGMYVKSKGLNALIYSHTYTEKLGVKNLANTLFVNSNEIEIFEISEPHY